MGGNMEVAIRRALASCNGGPGLTADELAERLGAPVPIVRTVVSGLVFDKTAGVTCCADGKRGSGRYVLGDSAPLRKVSG
jgi:hypothetical protein